MIDGQRAVGTVQGPPPRVLTGPTASSLDALATSTQETGSVRILGFSLGQHPAALERKRLRNGGLQRSFCFLVASGVSGSEKAEAGAAEPLLPAGLSHSPRAPGAHVSSVVTIGKGGTYPTLGN